MMNETHFQSDTEMGAQRNKHIEAKVRLHSRFDVFDPALLDRIKTSIAESLSNQSNATGAG